MLFADGFTLFFYVNLKRVYSKSVWGLRVRCYMLLWRHHYVFFQMDRSLAKLAVGSCFRSARNLGRFSVEVM